MTNYEQVVRDFEAIVRWAPDLVVLDEAQRIKNWATKTALTVKRLKPEFRLVLTGTPMENRLEELASIVEWVDDRALEPKWRLVPWHSAYADGAREVVGARNLDSLRTRLAPVLLRRVRAEVLSQLPPRQDSVIPVEMTAEQRDAHDELMQPIAKLAAHRAAPAADPGRVPAVDVAAAHPEGHRQRHGPAPLRGDLAGASAAARRPRRSSSRSPLPSCSSCAS